MGSHDDVECTAFDAQSMSVFTNDSLTKCYTNRFKLRKGSINATTLIIHF